MTDAEVTVDPVEEWEVRSNRHLLIQELNGGGYRQGRNSLSYTQGDQEYFCCLGVACDIYHEKTGKGEWDENRNFVLPDGHRIRGVDYAFDGYEEKDSLIFESYPPAEVMEFFGLKSDEVQRMANMNDGAGHQTKRDFKFIAGWVQAKHE